MENKFRIPLNGLVSGMNQFHWETGIEFFQEFENTEMQAAGLTVDAEALKAGRNITVTCHIGGSVTVLCDRCMEDLELPVDEDIRMDVRYGTEEASQQSAGNATDDEEEDLVEHVYVPEGETDIDLSQIIYDYVCLGLPMQRFHPEGGCNEAVLERLENGVSTISDEGAEDGETGENPFSALKGLFD